jgi:hypothetical protein
MAKLGVSASLLERTRVAGRLPLREGAKLMVKEAKAPGATAAGGAWLKVKSSAAGPVMAELVIWRGPVPGLRMVTT